MKFRVVTKDRLYDLDADSCEIYEGKFIRLFDNEPSVETRILPRMFGAAQTVEVKSTKKLGIALFPIEQVVLITPFAVVAVASAGEAGTAETPQSGSVHEHATAASGDAQS